MRGARIFPAPRHRYPSYATASLFHILAPIYLIDRCDLVVEKHGRCMILFEELRVENFWILEGFVKYKWKRLGNFLWENWCISFAISYLYRSSNFNICSFWYRVVILSRIGDLVVILEDFFCNFFNLFKYVGYVDAQTGKAYIGWMWTNEWYRVSKASNGR